MFPFLYDKSSVQNLQLATYELATRHNEEQRSAERHSEQQYLNGDRIANKARHHTL
jgi:hypothetical protein